MKILEQVKEFHERFDAPVSEKPVLIDRDRFNLRVSLIEEEFNELYDGDLDLAWKSFVDNQENGDCQGIVSTIIYEFKTVKKVFGEIEVDEPYIDDYGDEQTLMTHHWITINDKIYDFSKGTLRDYITWDDVYDVNVEGDEWRYKD